MPGGPPRPQKNLVQGGWKTFTFFGFISGEIPIAAAANIGTSQPTVSGPGAFQLQSGAGRLDSYIPLPRQSSGLSTPAVFYDSAVATSGGPFVLSGDTVLYINPGIVQLVSGQLATPTASGISTNFVPPSVPVPLGTPFNSGLCVNLRSGMQPFTINFSPEIPSVF